MNETIAISVAGPGLVYTCDVNRRSISSRQQERHRAVRVASAPCLWCGVPQLYTERTCSQCGAPNEKGGARLVRCVPGVRLMFSSYEGPDLTEGRLDGDVGTTIYRDGDIMMVVPVDRHTACAFLITAPRLRALLEQVETLQWGWILEELSDGRD